MFQVTKLLVERVRVPQVDVQAIGDIGHDDWLATLPLLLEELHVALVDAVGEDEQPTVTKPHVGRTFFRSSTGCHGSSGRGISATLHQLSGIHCILVILYHILYQFFKVTAGRFIHFPLKFLGIWLNFHRFLSF